MEGWAILDKYVLLNKERWKDVRLKNIIWFNRFITFKSINNRVMKMWEKEVKIKFIN